MRFSIIIPTYRNATGLTSAVASLLAQTYRDWEAIIIHDSPYDTSYEHFVSTINDARIHYRPNEITHGINYSKNKALKNLSANSQWVIFLNDTDYLAPDTLATLRELILLHSEKKWFFTNHAYKNGDSITRFPKPDSEYSYTRDCLLLRRGKGDVTHCIETKFATSASFPKHVKKNEEWFYFYQLGLLERFFYHDHNSTIASEKVNAQRKPSRGERFEIITQLLYEGATYELLHHPTFLLYITIRYIQLIFP
jgi:glycosyltransferase involved in cell wall biosynthesis